MCSTAVRPRMAFQRARPPRPTAGLPSALPSSSSIESQPSTSTVPRCRAATLTALAWASTCTSSAGVGAVMASSSTPDTSTSGSTPAWRSVRSRPGGGRGEQEPHRVALRPARAPAPVHPGAEVTQPPLFSFTGAINAEREEAVTYGRYQRVPNGNKVKIGIAGGVEQSKVAVSQSGYSHSLVLGSSYRSLGRTIMRALLSSTLAACAATVLLAPAADAAPRAQLTSTVPPARSTSTTPARSAAARRTTP